MYMYVITLILTTLIDYIHHYLLWTVAKSCITKGMATMITIIIVYDHFSLVISITSNIVMIWAGQIITTSRRDRKP